MLNIFSLKRVAPIKIYKSEYIPFGTVFFINDRDEDGFFKLLNEAEGFIAREIQLRKKLADLEYKIQNCLHCTKCKNCNEVKNENM